jgi:hypothetical protein
MRQGFRVAGVAVSVVAVVLIVVGFSSLFSSWGELDEPSRQALPTKFPYALFGLILLGVGGWLLRTGFRGVSEPDVSSEIAPLVEDAPATSNDRPYQADATEVPEPRPDQTTIPASIPGSIPGSIPASRRCAHCAVLSRSEDKFCSNCGDALA